MTRDCHATPPAVGWLAMTSLDEELGYRRSSRYAKPMPPPMHMVTLKRWSGGKTQGLRDRHQSCCCAPRRDAMARECHATKLTAASFGGEGCRSAPRSAAGLTRRQRLPARSAQNDRRRCSPAPANWQLGSSVPQHDSPLQDVGLMAVSIQWPIYKDWKGTEISSQYGASDAQRAGQRYATNVSVWSRTHAAARRRDRDAALAGP
jgi:hypothetical protein